MKRCRSGRWASLLLLLALATQLISCRAMFRFPAELAADESSQEELRPVGLNPYILTNLVSQRVVIEVDWVAGSTPHPRALERLRETLQRHLPEGKRIEIVVDDEIPLSVWRDAPGDFLAKGATLGGFVDRDPTLWDEAELIYVVYAPGRPPFLGHQVVLSMQRAGSEVPVSCIFMFQETIRSRAALWVTAARIERAILVHEIGHLLGLVSDPAHEQRGNPRHCTEPQCVMTRQRGRTQFYNALPALFAGQIPDDYCRKCRADIRRARERWSDRASRDPAFVEQLRERKEPRNSAEP